MDSTLARNWYDVDEIQQLTGVPERTLRRQLRVVSNQNIREDVAIRGRPRKLYHFEALPALQACHRLTRSADSVPAASDFVVNRPPAPKPAPKPPAMSPDDTALAELRLQAVLEFEARRKLLSAEEAATATCRDWAIRPHRRTVKIQHPLPGGYKRDESKTVTVGVFQPGTLRSWASLYRKSKNILDLVPQRKGRVGRKQQEVPEELLVFVYGLCNATSRSAVSRAVEYAKGHWPADQWPDVSIDTWRRRIKALDPRKVGKDLSHSVSKFRAKQSPDIEVNWDLIGYNDVWMIDDVHEDWYGFASDMETMIRPNAYVIMRARTRQWVAAVSTETPITQDQVRELVGFAMSQKNGGLPGKLKFERGTVAGDPYLDSLLSSLGVVVSRTSMDDGNVFPGAAKDRGVGHFQGKALCERGFRAHHELQWLASAQVGTDESVTAPGRLNSFLKLAAEKQKEGGFLLVPSPKQWQARIQEALEAHNNKPHGSLPEIVDPVTGQVRHMSPNELAQHLKAQSIRVMDERLLPLFSTKGTVVRVTRNGFTLNKRSYGRFDPDLQQYDQVLAYASASWPDVAYVHELQRTVDAYEKEIPGGSDQFAEKRRMERMARNQFEALMQRAVGMDGNLLLSSMCALSNPTPERPVEVVAPDALVEQVGTLRRGIAAHRERKARRDARFDMPTDEATENTTTARPIRRGMLDRAQDIAEQLAVLGPQEKTGDESWMM